MDCKYYAPCKSSMLAKVCQFSATGNPSVVYSGDRDPWPGWPAAWHVGPALPCITLHCLVLPCYPALLAWHVGPALAWREKEIGLTSLWLLCDTPSVDSSHASKSRSCESEAGAPHWRKGGHRGGEGLETVHGVITCLHQSWEHLTVAAWG